MHCQQWRNQTFEDGRIFWHSFEQDLASEAWHENVHSLIIHYCVVSRLSHLWHFMKYYKLIIMKCNIISVKTLSAIWDSVVCISIIVNVIHVHYDLRKCSKLIFWNDQPSSYYLHHYHIIIHPILFCVCKISIHSFIIELQYNHVLTLYYITFIILRSSWMWTNFNSIMLYMNEVIMVAASKFKLN